VNEEICVELGQVRDALHSVAASVSNLIPRGELDRAADVVTEDNRRWRRSVVLLIIGGPALFLLNLGILWQTHQSEISFRRDIREGMSCILGDEASHRHDQRNFETAVTQKLGVTVELGPATRIATEDLQVLTDKCEPILRRFAALGLTSQGAEGGKRP
jgi:hypothetical protein